MARWVIVISLSTLVTLAGGCGSKTTTPNTASTSAITPTTAASSQNSATAQPNEDALAKSGAALPGLLGGTAIAKLPTGEPGKVAVIATGPTELHGDRAPSRVPIIVRNNTNTVVGDPGVGAIARDPSGKTVGTGTSQGFQPATMQPGQAALGFVYFQPGMGLSNDTTFDFTVQSSPASLSPRSGDHTDLKVREANLMNGSVVGTATNATGQTVTGPYWVEVFCFDADGNLLGDRGDFASPDGDAEPGASVSFHVDLQNLPCSTFLVAVRANFA